MAANLTVPRFNESRGLEGAHPQAGFTLIGILVTLAILSFALVLDCGSRGRAGRRIAGSKAVLGNRSVTFNLELGSHRYRVAGGPTRQLPPQLDLELLAIEGERSASQTGHIRLNPDDSSSGGRIMLAD